MNTKHITLWATRTLALIGVLSLLVLLVQSAQNSYLATTSSSFDGYATEELAYDMAVESASIKTFRAPSPTALYDEAIAAETEQKVIKTGSLELVVDKADETAQTIETMATGRGGFVQYSSVREHEDGTRSGSVTLRVPADQYEDAMRELKDMALVVERETTNSDDVTERYIDLAARLKNAQAQEARYVEILELATTVEEVIQVESALGSIRATIESLQGQLNYLDSQTDFSTITVSLSEEPVITVGGKEFRPGTTVKQAGQAVVAIAQWAVQSLIWIVIVGIGVGLPLALIVWILWKAIRNMKVWRK